MLQKQTSMKWLRMLMRQEVYEAEAVLWGRMLQGWGKGQSDLTINAHVHDRRSKYDWVTQN